METVESRINAAAFLVLFAIVIALDLNFFWQVGNATYPEMGVLLMALFFVGHLCRTFLKPNNIFKSITFPLLSIISVAATTMSLVFISGSLQQAHNNSQNLIEQRQQELTFAEESLKDAKNSGFSNQNAVDLKVELGQLKSQTGFKNSRGHVVKGDLLKLTNNCQGGTSNSNWYLNNRAEMKAGCQRIDDIEMLLENMQQQDIGKLKDAVTQARKALNKAKASRGNVQATLIESVENLTGGVISFDQFMTGVALIIAALLELLFKGCSPACQSGGKTGGKFATASDTNKKTSEKAASEKNRPVEKQQVSVNAKPTQKERTANAGLTQIGGKTVAKQGANITLTCFADVSDDTLGNYIDLPENMNDSLKIALAYILIIYSENPAEGKTIPERATSDEIGERTRNAPSWMKAIIPDQGVNHKSIATAKKLLHKMGYLNKEIRQGKKRTTTHYSWKSPEQVLAVIKQRMPPPNIIEFRGNV